MSNNSEKSSINYESVKRNTSSIERKMNSIHSNISNIKNSIDKTKKMYHKKYTFYPGDKLKSNFMSNTSGNKIKISEKKKVLNNLNKSHEINSLIKRIEKRIASNEVNEKKYVTHLLKNSPQEKKNLKDNIQHAKVLLKKAKNLKGKLQKDKKYANDVNKSIKL
jgi:hypothetical protein